MRRLEDLPSEARRYLDRIESLVEAPIRFVSVGSRRDQIIELDVAARIDNSAIRFSDAFAPPAPRRAGMHVEGVSMARATSSGTASVAIIGAGPCGLAAGIALKRVGIRSLIYDRSCLVSGIASYPVYMTFFSTAERIAIGDLPFVTSGEKPTRREALGYYRLVAQHFGLGLRLYESVTEVAREGAHFVVRSMTPTGHVEMPFETVVVATGYFGNPNLLHVPGESLPHVTHVYQEGHEAFRRDVIVVGGGNSAVDAALDLWRCGGKVTMVHFKERLDDNIKPWVLPDITNRLSEGSIGAHWRSRVTRIDADSVTIEGPDGTKRLPATRVYLMTGFTPNIGLLQQLGVPINAATGVPRHDPATMETEVEGVFIAGSLAERRSRQQGVHRERARARRADRPAVGGSPCVGRPALNLSPLNDLMPSAYPDVMEKLVSLCKRHGFVFQSSEIYGGTGSVVGLRSARSGAQKERQGPLVAGDGAVARRHRRAGRGDPHAPAGVGGERPRGRLHRSARRLQDVPRPVPRRSAG